MHMQIVVDSLLTHYERVGRGPIVLILPGWADTSRSWVAVQKALSGTHDVIVLDLPGFGGSARPEQPWGLTEYAAFVGHFLQKLDIKQPQGIIGHSNGGAIAIRGLARADLTTDNLVLVASAGIRNRQSGRNLLLRMVTKTGKVITAPLPSRVRRGLRSQLYKRAGSDMLVAENMQESFKRIVADDVQADAALLEQPTLLIYGDKDTETPLAFGQTYNKLIANSTLQVIPGAGHFTHVEQTDELTNKIEEFLR